MVATVDVGNAKPVLWPHWLAAMEVFILAVVVGMVAGWTSPYMAKLTSDDAVVSVTEEEASWIAALPSIGRIGGCINGALIIDHFGTRTAVLHTGVPLALGWILLLFTDSVWWIYAARIFGGFSMGMYFSTFPLYMGEVANPRIRGALVGLIAQGLPVGVFLGNLVGAYTPMWLFSCISLVPNFAFLASFMAMPDSPYYLIREGRFDDAKKSLEWYNRGVDVTPELNSLREFISCKAPVGYRDQLAQLMAPTDRKAFLIVFVIFIAVQLCGLWTTSFYMEIILKNAGVTAIKPSIVVIIVGVSGIVVGWASLWMNDKCGRKIMLATSCIGVSLAYIILGLDYQMLGMNFKSELFTQWLPIIAVIMFQSTLCLGIANVPSTLVSELLSPDLKSTAICIANLCSSIVAFLSSKTYQPMVDLTGEQFVFWFYGFLMLCLAIYTLVCIPETKGKSLQEIQKMLHRKLDTTDLKNTT